MKTSFLVFMLIISLSSWTVAETAENVLLASNKQQPMFISLLPALTIPEAGRQMLIADQINAGRLKIRSASAKKPKLSEISTLHKASHYTGGVAAIFDGGSGLFEHAFSGKEMQWKRTGSMILLSSVARYSGTMADTAIQNVLVKNSSQLAAKVAMPQLRGLAISRLSGNLVTGAMFSYGAYFLGYSDARTANRNMIATAGGTAVGALASVTAMGVVSTFATASTGTAISALSGAAATNATLAWFGGGAIAAGGGGTALGATILSGGTAAVVIAAGAGIMYLFHLDDEHTERERVAYLIQSIQQHLNQKSTPH